MDWLNKGAVHYWPTTDVTSLEVRFEFAAMVQAPSGKKDRALGHAGEGAMKSRSSG